MSDITPEERESLKQAFGLYDRDGDGSITAAEFSDILKSLNVGATDKEIEAIIQAVDRNHDGQIDFEEFVLAMTDHLHSRDHSTRHESAAAKRAQSFPQSGKRLSYHESDELNQVFNAFDKNGDGFISIEELKEVMSRLGENLNDHELKEMMQEADINKDGLIDFKEFKKLIPPP
ncbi:calmodulin 2 [Dichotomocladium elegans]|nr:calmodulin 2 [Dichotomocladium elegans]